MKKEGRMGLSTALARAAFLVNAVYTDTGREYGVTPQQGQLLCCLRAQPYGMGELGTVLGLAKSSITGLVDRSERSGLVRREPDPRDSRAVRVALTPHGSTIADGFYGDGRRHIEDLPASLTEAERNTLADLLSRMVNDHRVSAIFMELDEPAA